MLLRCGLRVAALPYSWAVRIRNRKFDNQPSHTQSVSVPVISVGNLTTGGTGKTPIVAYLAKWFRAHGIRVAIVSRGYGRGDASENDEAKELHQRLPDVPHIQDPDRVAAAQITIDELETQLILMDDGFQHRRLGRDLDIVLIDMTCPFGYGYVLPRGLLREPIASLSRADLVILTRCDQVSEKEIDDVLQTIRKVKQTLPVVRCSHQASGLLTYPNTTCPLDQLSGKRILMVSGIGNPDAFQRSLTDQGATVVGRRDLADHVEFDREVIRELETWVRSFQGADMLVCTHKDLVKIQADRLAGLPLMALTIEAKVDASDEFEHLLQQVKVKAEAIESEF